VTTTTTTTAAMDRGILTRGAKVRPAGTRDPAVGVGVSPGGQSAPPAAGTGVLGVPVQEVAAALGTGAMGMTTWDTGCRRGPDGTRLVEAGEVVVAMVRDGIVGIEGLQDGATGDGITEVLLVVGTMSGVLRENGIIAEVLLEVGIIVEVLLEVGIAVGVIREVGIIAEVLEVGITEGVLLVVGTTVGGLLVVRIIEEVLMVVGIIEEAGITEEEAGIIEVLPVVGIAEEVPLENGTVEVVLAAGTVVEVLAGEVLEVIGGKKGVPLREEDGTKEEMEEDGPPVGVVLDGMTEDQDGVPAAVEEVHDGTLEVVEGDGMDQIGDGRAVAEGVRREAGVMIEGTRQGGTMTEGVEEGIGAAGVAETGGEILLHRAEEAGENAGELQTQVFCYVWRYQPTSQININN